MKLPPLLSECLFLLHKYDVTLDIRLMYIAKLIRAKRIEEEAVEKKRLEEEEAAAAE